jgi:hypothetical protein
MLESDVLEYDREAAAHIRNDAAHRGTAIDLDEHAYSFPTYEARAAERQRFSIDQREPRFRIRRRFRTRVACGGSGDEKSSDSGGYEESHTHTESVARISTGKRLRRGRYPVRTTTSLSVPDSAPHTSPRRPRI